MERKKSNSRSSGASSARSYNVGRGKPPVHTRFRKGQSGNPSGLPKGADERGRRIGLAPAAMRGLRKKAASGDSAAARLLWEIERASAGKDTEQSTRGALNTEADKCVVEQLVLRLREMIKREGHGNTDNT
jgi:hypothetical protein